MIRKSVLFFFLLSLQTLYAQDIVLDKFQGDALNGKIKLSWTIASGSTCNGTEIQHSLDSLNWKKVGQIDGICGDPNQSVSYDFTHSDPQKNSTNYYRLLLGSVQLSNTIALEIIDLGEDNYFVRPNPITHAGTLFFKNDNQLDFQVRFFDKNGQLIQEMQTNSNQLSLHANDFPNGIVYFSIQHMSTRKVIQGKILIVKE